MIKKGVKKMLKFFKSKKKNINECLFMPCHDVQAKE